MHEWIVDRVASTEKCLEDKVRAMLNEFFNQTGRMDIEDFKISVAAYRAVREKKIADVAAMLV